MDHTDHTYHRFIERPISFLDDFAPNDSPWAWGTVLDSTGKPREIQSNQKIKSEWLLLYTISVDETKVLTILAAKENRYNRSRPVTADDLQQHYNHLGITEADTMSYDEYLVLLNSAEYAEEEEGE
jgi:hypothetical protein